MQTNDPTSPDHTGPTCDKLADDDIMPETTVESISTPECPFLDSQVIDASLKSDDEMIGKPIENPTGSPNDNQADAGHLKYIVDDFVSGHNDSIPEVAEESPSTLPGEPGAGTNDSTLPDHINQSYL